MQDVPVPSVTRDDVVRVVHREFPDGDEHAILEILDQYDARDGQTEVHRVQLAILKLSDGSLESLSDLVETANTDFRDVLAPAESPGFCDVGFVGLGQMSDSEVNQIIDADWRQYSDWLNAP